MKKIFSLIAIAAVASTMFTSCSSKDETPTPTPTPGKAKLTLSGDKLTVAVAATGKFTIISDIAAPEAIVIEVKSSDATKLTVDPASVTIAKDKKTIEGTYTGVADGKAKITITTTSTVASVEKGEIEVTVGEKAPELPELMACDEANPWPDQWLGPEESFGFTLWFNAGVVLLENLGADYYGADLELKAAEKGVDIATLTLTKNLEHVTMGSNKADGFDKLPSFAKIGAAQYIVFSITEVETDDHNTPQITGWALVSASDNGTSVILHEIKFPATKVGE